MVSSNDQSAAAQPGAATSTTSAGSDFDWEEAASWLDGLPDGRGLNIAHEAVDRHVLAGHGDRVALRHLRKTGDVVDVTYGELRASTNRFANVLEDLGVGRGQRVFLLAGRVPELYTAALGTLKRGSVLCPLFAAFGPVAHSSSRSVARAVACGSRPAAGQ